MENLKLTIVSSKKLLDSCVEEKCFFCGGMCYAYHKHSGEDKTACESCVSIIGLVNDDVELNINEEHLERICDEMNIKVSMEDAKHYIRDFFRKKPKEGFGGWLR